jgi:hypothetical protein
MRSCRSAEGTGESECIRGLELDRARAANAADDGEAGLPFESRGPGIALQQAAEPVVAVDAAFRERQVRRVRLRERAGVQRLMGTVEIVILGRLDGNGGRQSERPAGRTRGLAYHLYMVGSVGGSSGRRAPPSGSKSMRKSRAPINSICSQNSHRPGLTGRATFSVRGAPHSGTGCNPTGPKSSFARL